MTFTAKRVVLSFIKNVKWGDVNCPSTMAALTTMPLNNLIINKIKGEEGVKIGRDIIDFRNSLVGLKNGEPFLFTHFDDLLKVIKSRYLITDNEAEIIETKTINDYYKEGYDYAFQTKGIGDLSGKGTSFIGGFNAGKELYNFYNKN